MDEQVNNARDHRRFYYRYFVYRLCREQRASREPHPVRTAKRGHHQLEEKLGQTNDQIGQLDKTNKDLMKTVSLAPNLRVEYGNGVCLIVGVYDLVDKKSGKVLRYADRRLSAESV